MAKKNSGFCDVLSQLTTVGKYTQSDFERQFDQIKKLSELRTHFIITIEDTNKQRIVALGSLFIEKKFTHHISNVCVSPFFYLSRMCVSTFNTYIIYIITR
jgi:hypothetical protein